MPWLGTFHCDLRQMLRRHAELVGLKTNFTILDTDDQIRLLKQLIVAANIDDKRWPARMLAGIIDGWKNRRWTPDKSARSETGAYRNGRARALRAYQDAAENLNAVDFGDLLLHMRHYLQDHPTSCDNIATGSATSWSTNIRTPTSPSTCGCGCWRRGTRTSAASATTISRSMAGAGPRSATSCGSRRISRRQGDPAGAELPLHPAHPRRRSGVIAPIRRRWARRCGPKRRRREGRLMRPWDGEEEARWIGDEIEALQRARGGPSLTIWRSWSAPASRCARSKTGSDHRPAVPRDRRPAFLRTRRNPRRAWPISAVDVSRRRSGVRAHRQHPKRGLGDKSDPDHAVGAHQGRSCCEGARLALRQRRAIKGKGAPRRWAKFWRGLTAGAGQARTPSSQTNWPR